MADEFSEWSKQIVGDIGKEPIMEYILMCYLIYRKIFERFKGEESERQDE